MLSLTLTIPAEDTIDTINYHNCCSVEPTFITSSLMFSQSLYIIELSFDEMESRVVKYNLHSGKWPLSIRKKISITLNDYFWNKNITPSLLPY